MGNMPMWQFRQISNYLLYPLVYATLAYYSYLCVRAKKQQRHGNNTDQKTPGRDTGFYLFEGRRISICR